VGPWGQSQGKHKEKETGHDLGKGHSTEFSMMEGRVREEKQDVGGAVHFHTCTGGNQGEGGDLHLIIE